VFGADPAHPRNRVRTGAMLQVSGVPATLTVAEHIELFSSYYPRPLPRTETLRLASLEGLAKRRFGQLSGGQKQRLFFALAICGDPDILFLDEPTVGLDIETRQLMWSHIRGFVARGKSVLLTTHYLGEADALADRIALITKGTIVAQGTPEAIKTRAAATDLETAYLTLTGAAARMESFS
jgi:ABC-2 type transport system ATP-binding protein